MPDPFDHRSTVSRPQASWTVRPGGIDDSKCLAALINSFLPMLTIDPTGAGAEHFLASVSEAAEREYLQSPRYSYLVAEHDGMVLGFIAMRDKTHLFHLFVAAGHQHKGIAAALWQRARELAIRADGVSEFTVNSSLNAQPVYERFGFVRFGDAVQAHGMAFQPMQLRLGQI